MKQNIPFKNKARVSEMKIDVLNSYIAKKYIESVENGYRPITITDDELKICELYSVLVIQNTDVCQSYANASSRVSVQGNTGKMQY